MKGTNFRRILCILIAAMLCIGLLPIGAAADSYAAAAELRSMQKVRREIDGELFELESELDSDLSAVETVDSLFEYLDGDSRIKSINRQDGTTFGYTLKSGMTVVYDYNIVHGIREGSEPVKIELSSAEEVRGILDDGAVTASNRNVAVYAPYLGIDEGIGAYYSETFAPVISSYTGGTLTVYGGNECDVTDLTEMYKYGVIMFDSHGLEYDGLSYIAIHNENGVTASDYSNGWVVELAGGGIAVNYLYLNHYATATMPGSYVHLATCSGGKDGNLLNYFTSHGASVALGYDETVTVAYDVYIFQDILNSMRGLGVSECYNIGQALDYAKSRRGEYDPYYYEDEGIYTHPVLAGNRNWYFPPLYTVNFIVEGQTAAFESFTVTKNTVLNLSDFPTPPTIPGKNFSHWRGPNGETVTGSLTITANTNIIASYTVPTCTVQWVDGATEQVLKTLNMPIGDTVMAEAFPEPPEHEGKTFEYWSVNGSEFFGSSYYLTGDTTFRAEYSNEVYTVSFYSGLTGELIGTRTAEYGTEIPLSEFPKAPDAVGYNFAEWQYADGSAVSGSINVTENTSCYAAYEAKMYTVKFWDNHTDVILRTDTVPYGTVIKAEDFPEHIEHEGYDFKGWYGYGEFLDEVTVVSNVIIYATYEQHPYTVTFVDGYTGETLQSVTVLYDNGLYRDEFPVPPVHENADFVGWYVEGTLFEGSYLRVLGDMTVTAVYSGFETHTITLVDSDTGETYETYEVRTGTEVDLADLPMPPYREGMVFVGWLVNGELMESGTVIVNEDMVITAVLRKETFTVRFYDTMADSFFVTMEDVEYGTVLRVSDFPAPPVHEGMEFAGWNYNGRIITEETVTITQPMVFAAVYAPRTCNLTVIDDYTGETLLDTPVSVGFSFEVSEIPVPTHEGMVFVGWFINGELVTDEIITVEEDTVIHAVFEPEAPVIGDINGDGTIGIDDALMLMRYAIGTEDLTDEQAARADLNGDGAVDVFDALLALRAALNGEQPPCIKPQNTAGKTEA